MASLTVGQTPRSDLLPDILAQLPMALEVQEFGALDGLSEREIAGLAPRAGETCLVTRLRSGVDVVVSRPWVMRRMEELCRGIDATRFDLLIVLTTGLFREFESECPTVNAQRAIDAVIAALAGAGQTVGVIYPLRRQVDENAAYSVRGCALRLTHAAGGDAAELLRAADDLRGCDLVVLNSVAYAEADRQVVAGRMGRPAILARRVVAGAIQLLLDPGGTRRPAPPPAQAAGADRAVLARMRTLTPRERQVMSLVAEGLSNKAIARQLTISPRTVEIHRARMMEKMGASSVGALVRMALAAQYPGL